VICPNQQQTNSKENEVVRILSWGFQKPWSLLLLFCFNVTMTQVKMGQLSGPCGAEINHA
jgi:hypothetical protein